MNPVIGHGAPIAAFLSAMRGPKLHHAWLMSGPQGVGKATTAMLLAKRLLSEAAGPPIDDNGVMTPPDHRIGRLIDGYAHPDFFLLERLPKDAKAVRDVGRADWPADLERARSVTVDQVREVGKYFSLKPSFSDRRVVIIDSIDDLEPAGANALLKSLEEPPAGTIFLLVSHSSGKLLPTIRSRCRMVRFNPLSDFDMRAALTPHLPKNGEADIASLLTVSIGSPGRALGFAGLNIGAIDEALSQIAQNGDPSNGLRSSLAQSLSLKSAQKRYEAFLTRAPAFIAGEAKRRGGDALPVALGAWDAARSLADSALRQSLDVQMTVFAMASHVAALAPKAPSSKG